MKIVRFEIKDHADRINVLKALVDNGYDAKIEVDTSYIPTKVFIYTTVDEYEVSE
jgi:hypothetical protein